MSAASLALRVRPLGGSLRRWGPALLVSIAALGALYHFVIRDLPLFAVEAVRVEGIPALADDGDELAAALTEAAKDMTTLHVQPELLERAAAPFPMVESVSAEAEFPHKLVITVHERRPAAEIGGKNGSVVVSRDGTILEGMSGKGIALPRLPIDRLPREGRIGGPVMDQVRVLRAVPPALQPYLAESARGPGGVDVVLRGGIVLHFGGSTRTRQKWLAAAAVLADPELTALDYVDLTAPNRPAVGGAGHTLPPLP